MNAVQPVIDYYPLNLAADSLGVSEATLRRWSAKLRKKKVEELDHQPYEQVISSQSMQVYQRLADLRKQKISVDKAVQKIRIEGI